ncbi:MAG: DUF368 domain-containing protein [Planctomycetales bacterium]|nr:DUF368 domain-containing protein [Planctomycetales bacterium]
MVEKDEKKSAPYLLFTGMCMGAADIVPGVSGGTMAFLLGIYSQLLDAVKSVDMEFATRLLQFQFKSALQKVPWAFILPIGIGIVLSAVSLSKLLSYCLEYHNEQLMSFFFGLIVASIVALAARHTWSAGEFVALAVGTLFAYWLVGLVPATVPHTPLILFGCGVLAISAMILPGISGAFILLILGQYEHCVATLDNMIDHVRAAEWSMLMNEILSTVAPIGLGCVIGLMLFSRVLSWLLKHFHGATVATLIGFMVGSLRRIWPYKEILESITDRHGDLKPIRWENTFPADFNSDVAIAIALCVAGFVAVSVLDHVQDRSNPIVGLVWPKSNPT